MIRITAKMASEMTKYATEQEASKAIADKLAQAQQLFRECAAIAEEANVEVHTDILGLWGTGVTYIPKSEREEWGEETQERLEEDGGWMASASSC